MVHDRQAHWRFLEEELRAQVEAYKQKLDTAATTLLLDREELFVARYLMLKEGELILKFSNARSLPRQGEYLYCFTLPEELRDHRHWDNRTYGDLVKAKLNYSEVVCIWQAPSNEVGFSIAGFRGVESAFAQHLEGAEGAIVFLGPHKPPFEYLVNLQSVVRNQGRERLAGILDQDFQDAEWTPALLDAKKDIPEFLLAQLALEDTVIVQGPPGTGKTHMIAELCRRLCMEGRSVLVTALTNRALIEVAEKPALQGLMGEQRIFKTKISVDERRLLPDLQALVDVAPMPGNLVLSTFHVSSGVAAAVAGDPPFDHVIVDEASQALLGMLGAARLLGGKNLWIGDVRQLPPVVTMNEDKVERAKVGPLVDGLHSLSSCGSIPVFQLTETHRLTERAARYTGLFYYGTLRSKNTNGAHYSDMRIDVGRYFHPAGGPTLLKVGLDVGDRSARNAHPFVLEILSHLLDVEEPLHIAVLVPFVATAKALQRTIFQTFGYHKNILVETISRVQGLTTDVTIQVIPNTYYNWSLERRLFNVATSRARRHTLILADRDILKGPQMDGLVRQYLAALDEEYSFQVELPELGEKMRLTKRTPRKLPPD
ncbi:MAG TPA: AAA domain-containing protein [Flavobacteriales bacterium]|nr:AAA domain-containing protein [Flavobacteriales bacterium]